MADLGSLTASLGVDTRGLNSAERAFQNFSDKASRHAADIESKYKSAFKKIGIAAAAGAAAASYALFNIGKSALKAASDLEEVSSKFDTVFKGRTQQAEQFAKVLVDSYAMSTREAKQYLSSVQDLLVPMGMQAEAAAKMSNEVVKLSADLGSFNNLPTAQVMDDIQSALVGNYETMKKYGVVLNMTTVQEEALAMGLANTAKELTAGQKAQAAYKLMVEGSAAAIGDMERTMGSYANQVKQLGANLEDLKALIGNELLPVVTDVVKKLNKWIKEVDLKTWAENAASGLKTAVDAVGFLSEGLQGMWRGWLAVKRAFLATEELALKLKLWANEGEASEKKIRMELIATQQAISSVSNAILEMDKAYAKKSSSVMVMEELRDTAIATHSPVKTLAEGIENAGSAVAVTEKEMKHLAKALEAVRTAVYNQNLAKATRAYTVFAASVGNAHDVAISFAKDLNQIQYDEMLQEIKDQENAYGDLIERIKAANDELDDSSLFDGSIFGDGANQSVNNLMESLSDLYDMYGKLAKREKQIAKMREDAAKLVDPKKQAAAFKAAKDLETRYAMDSIQAQMDGFTQLFGAIKNMYAENSAEHERWAMIEKATAIASILLKAATAIINAGASGDGYTAVARMAAVAAAVGSVLSQVGLSISGPGGSSGGGSEPAKYTPGSTLLGADPDTASESIIKAFERLESIDIDQYGKLIDIYMELRQLNFNIMGLATSVVRTGAIGSLNLPTGSDSPIAKDIEKYVQISTFIAGGLFIDELLGGLIGKAAGWLFGGDVSFEILESGLQHFGESIIHMGDVISGVTELAVRPYLWYEQTISGGVIGSDDKQRKVKYGDKIDEASRLITGIVKNIGETMLDLADILGFGEETIEKIKEYTVALNTIDLKNLNAEQIQEALGAWFSNFADKMAEDVFGELLTRYQKADEGLFETAIRLAVEKEMILEVLDLTGQAFHGTGLEAVHFSQALIEVAGGLEGLTEAATTYFEEYFTEAEKQAWLLDNLADAYNTMGITMPKSRQEFKDLMSSIDLTTDAGKELYVALLEIAGATDSYYDALEAANQTIIDAQRKLSGTEEEGTIIDIEARYGWKLDAETAFKYIDAFLSMSSEEIMAYAESMGVTTEQLVSDILKLAEVFDYLGSTTIKTAADFAKLREQIENMLTNVSSTFGAPESAAAIMSQITDLQSIPMAEQTPENLLAMSEKLVQWYNAAVAEAQKAAQEEQRLAQLQIQLADRIKSLVDQVDSTIRSITYSALNVSLPQQKAAEATEDYTKLLAAAQTGGTAEIQEYLSFAQTYLTQQQEDLKSSVAYQEKYASVIADMEAIKAKAEAGGYDEQILAELQKGNAQIDVDLTEIQAQFSEMESWILNALETLETISLIININWENFTGDQAEALKMLLALVEVYGWDHEYTLKFLAEVPMTIFSDLNDLARAAGWIADASGGWNSSATITFLKNVAENWEWENIDEILAAVGWVKEQAGSWGADATIAFMMSLMDRYNVPFSDMHDWLTEVGLTDLEIPEVMAKLVLQAYGGGMPIDEIDDYLTSLGITDTALQRTIKIQMIYEMVSEGQLDFKQVSDYVYNQAYAAWLMNPGASEAVNILNDLQALGQMWGVANAYNLGHAVNYYGGYASELNAWMDLWTRHGLPNRWAEGGIATQPTWGVYGEAGPEAFLRLAENRYVPIPSLNGGSTRAGAGTPIEINLTLELDGEPLDTKIKVLARNESENVRVNLVRWGKQNSPKRQSV